MEKKVPVNTPSDGRLLKRKKLWLYLQQPEKEYIP